jgi:hypothetical protein
MSIAGAERGRQRVGVVEVGVLSVTGVRSLRIEKASRQCFAACESSFRASNACDEDLKRQNN